MNGLELEYVALFRACITALGIVSHVHEDLILEYRNEGKTVREAVEIYYNEINKAKIK